MKPFSTGLIGAVWVSLFAVDNAAFAQASADRPNIIVFYTDDHGHADLSCQGVFDDVKTPNVDALAASGVRAVNGYSTAPQCVPSRGGLIVGKFQGRFGLDNNGSSLDGFDAETTMAERLQAAGYATAQFGKWHLGPTPQITEHGFKHVYAQNSQASFSANITLEGEDQPMAQMKPEMYHVDACSRAAASVIKRYKGESFFLYVAYRAPHVPLDAPKTYLDRFPGEMPERRRQALAMLSAVDDGVGLVTETLKELGLTDKTLIFYIGDNGAPLKIHKADEPGGGPGWDGSLNDPLNGEKGMLSEGGMHVPFVIAWPGVIPGGQEYPHPVSSLDVAATAVGVQPSGVWEGSAKAYTPTAGDLDGVNLIPFLSGEKTEPPHEALYWRWSAQSAIREGDWKLLRGGDREYLYNLSEDIEEKHNLGSQEPEIANRLRAKLTAWCGELNPPGLATGPMAATWNDYFDFYLEGKPAPPLREKFLSENEDEGVQGWLARNGGLEMVDGTLQVKPDKKGKAPFLTKAKLKIPTPAVATITLKSEVGGPVGVAWRMDGDKDFLPENKASSKFEGSDEWQTVEIPISSSGRLIHLRVLLPEGGSAVSAVDLVPKEEKPVKLIR